MKAEKPGFLNNTFAPIALTLEEWGYTNTRVPPQPARIQAHGGGLRLCSPRLLVCKAFQKLAKVLLKKPGFLHFKFSQIK